MGLPPENTPKQIGREAMGKAKRADGAGASKPVHRPTTRKRTFGVVVEEISEA
jgi:hypothetical protein